MLIKIQSYVKLSIVAGLATVLFSCKNDLKELENYQGNNVPVQTTYNAVYNYSDSARITTEISTPQLDRYEGDSSYAVFPIGVHVEFLNELGKTDSKLDAKYGIWLEDKRTVEVQKEVVFVNEKGDKLETEKLIWYQDSARVFTDEFVKITQEGSVIYGHGMEAAEDFSWYKLKRISGEFEINEDEF